MFQNHVLQRRKSQTWKKKRNYIFDWSKDAHLVHWQWSRSGYGSPRRQRNWCGECIIKRRWSTNHIVKKMHGCVLHPVGHLPLTWQCQGWALQIWIPASCQYRTWEVVMMAQAATTSMEDQGWVPDSWFWTWSYPGSGMRLGNNLEKERCACVCICEIFVKNILQLSNTNMYLSCVTFNFKNSCIFPILIYKISVFTLKEILAETTVLKSLNLQEAHPVITKHIAKL